MRFIVSLVLAAFLSVPQGFAQKSKRNSVSDYIKTYRDIAISEMHRSGIPASITLAQGILESDNGNSSLVTEGNNHFGIKCHDWEGKTMYHDDETKGECFRKYTSAQESFHDHTDFLRTKSRYSFLFDYPSTDYKNWAHGLKKAGYATNPNYPQLLIKLIEDNKLYSYDQEVFVDKPSLSKPRRKGKKAEEDNFTFKLVSHEIFERNRIQYIVTKQGDSFGKLADEMELMRWELPKYNDINPDSALHIGEILYIQPKKFRAAKGQEMHIVKEGESMWSISQLFGVKLNRLYKRNRMEPGTQPLVGDTIYLRWKRRK
jgi:hypothetical protein